MSFLCEIKSIYSFIGLYKIHRHKENIDHSKIGSGLKKLKRRALGIFVISLLKLKTLIITIEINDEHFYPSLNSQLEMKVAQALVPLR
jgi:hypothetical protein